ncbi:MAG: hypothetical protein LBP52_09190 [Burkholderiaceae bacterium]|jgi:preprotein translocase subunit SecF|nr:hypothetical protein [Burkholderiaceae bacterium]
MSKIESMAHALASLLASTAFLKELALFALCASGACFLFFNVKRLQVLVAVPLLILSLYFAFSASRALDWHMKCPGGYGKNFFNSSSTDVSKDAPAYCDSVEEGQARKAREEARKTGAQEEDQWQRAHQQQQQEEAKHMRANRDVYLQALRQTAAAEQPQAAPALAEPANAADAP